MKKNKTYIIAEIGNNHEGSFKNSVKLIEQAAIAGVNAVKFQTFKVESFLNNLEKKNFKKYKNFQLTFNEFEKLSYIAKKKGLEFISTPLDVKSAEFLAKIVDRFKISSGDNKFYELIDKIISFKKKTIISTGLLNFREIKNLINLIKKKNFSLGNLTLLHCVSAYPVPDNETNLNSITFLKKKFKNIKIGYSDHTIGFEAGLASVAFGADVIEKHFTLDNNFSNFRDHKLSLNPNSMKSFVNSVRRLEKMIGKEEKIVQKSEFKNFKYMRRSLYATQDIDKNTKISSKHIKIVRPYADLGIIKTGLILGKKLKKEIKKGQFFKKSFF